MSLTHLLIAFICTGIVAVAGCASKTAPLVNYQDKQVSTGSGKADMAKVKKAIILGGTRAGWQMQPGKDGYILGSLFEKGAMAKVDITYTAQTYNITYKHSSNLLYNGTEIHKQYNEWVDNLNDSIRAELSKL